MSLLPGILKEVCRPFNDSIAECAVYYDYGFDRIYKLERASRGIVVGAQRLQIYEKDDQCVIMAEETDPNAWDVNQFDVHGLVRTILDETNYVLTYVDEDVLSEEQAVLVGVELE